MCLFLASRATHGTSLKASRPTTTEVAIPSHPPGPADICRRARVPHCQISHRPCMAGTARAPEWSVYVSKAEDGQDCGQCSNVECFLRVRMRNRPLLKGLALAPGAGLPNWWSAQADLTHQAAQSMHEAISLRVAPHLFLGEVTVGSGFPLNYAKRLWVFQITFTFSDRRPMPCPNTFLTADQWTNDPKPVYLGSGRGSGIHQQI